MDSRELQGRIAGILWCMDTSDEDCGIKATKRIMSLLSKECWLRASEATPGALSQPVKPIEEV